MGAVKVQLSAEDVEEVRVIAKNADAVHGDRYNPGLMPVLFGDTPELK